MLLYRKQLYAKLSCYYSSSRRVISFRFYPFAFTFLTMRGRVLTIFTQYEHQVAVKYRPKQRYLKSRILPYFPEAVSVRLPKVERYQKIDTIVQNKLILTQMQQCALCDHFAFQYYKHRVYAYTLCLECIPKVGKRIKCIDFIFISIIGERASKQTLQSNKIITLHRKSLRMLSQEGLLKRLNEILLIVKNDKEDSESLTISTQDSEYLRDSSDKEEKGNKERLKEKCQEAVAHISKEFQPYKETFSKTKDRFANVGAKLRDKVKNAHNHYQEFSSEMPPITREVKKTIGSFISKFF